MKSQFMQGIRPIIALFVALVCAVSLVPVPQARAYADPGALMVAQSLKATEDADDVAPVYAGVGILKRSMTWGALWSGWSSASDQIGYEKGKGLSTFGLKLTELTGLSGSIRYRAYKRDAGWTDECKDGQSIKKMRNLEAVKIRLTGEVSRQYDVLYRTYVSGRGWLPWVKNNAKSGVTGKKLRVNAIQVKLSAKTMESVGKSTNSVGIMYEAYCKTTGWQDWRRNGKVAGSARGAKQLSSFAVALDTGSLNGGVKYRAYNQDVRWSDWKVSGAAGNSSHQLEGIQIKLTGAIAKKYDVYYRAYVQGNGWLDWAKNGASAGSGGYKLRLQAFQVKLVKKGEAAPGETQYPTVNLMEKSRTLNGIDIASYQAGINIYAVDADFVIVKATEGTSYLNPYFKQWADAVLASGKQLGIYHFATDGSSAKAQADYFYKTVKPYIGRAVLFLDWENTSYSDVMSKGPSFAKAWLDRVHSLTGVKPLIYISQSTTWNYNWSAVAKKYKLWLAQYLYANEYSNGYLNNLSHWDIGYWGSETIYQYSSTAHINGYDGRLDVNKFYGSVQSWRNLASKG